MRVAEHGHIVLVGEPAADGRGVRRLRRQHGSAAGGKRRCHGHRDVHDGGVHDSTDALCSFWPHAAHESAPPRATSGTAAHHTARPSPYWIADCIALRISQARGLRGRERSFIRELRQTIRTGRPGSVLWSRSAVHPSMGHGLTPPAAALCRAGEAVTGRRTRRPPDGATGLTNERYERRDFSLPHARAPFARAYCGRSHRPSLARELGAGD